MPDYTDLQHRRGKFYVSVAILENAPEQALHLIDGCFVLRAELRYDRHAFEYVALHPSFAVVDPGMKTPTYDLVLTGNQAQFRKRIA